MAFHRLTKVVKVTEVVALGLVALVRLGVTAATEVKVAAISTLWKKAGPPTRKVLTTPRTPVAASIDKTPLVVLDR